MLNTVRSERIKLTSTAGTWISVVGIALLGFGMAVAQSLLVKAGHQENGYTMGNGGATAGVRGLGLMVIMALAALSVTQEYRFKTILTSFQATPSKWRVIGAKGLVVGAFAFLTAVVLGALTIPVALALVPENMRSDLGFATAARPLLTLGAYFAAAALLAIGVGCLLRSTAAAVALVVLWPSMIELMLTSLPTVGQKIAPYLPFTNADYGVSGKAGDLVMPWSANMAMAYFAGVAVLVFAAGVIAVQRRDA